MIVPPSRQAIQVEQEWRKAAGDQDELDVLARIAARLEPALRRRLLQAFAEMQDNIDLEDLAHAAQHGTAEQLAAAAKLSILSASLAGVSIYLRQGAAGGGQHAVNLMAAAGIDPTLFQRFDLVNVHAVDWANRRGGELIVGITDETRNALPVIRHLITESARGIVDVQELARDLRPAIRAIGLTERAARAVDTYRTTLLDDGLTGDKLNSRIEKYAEALLRKRAQTIARTETITASNKGQQEIWEEAGRHGLINKEETVRVWMAFVDERVDTEICLPLDGEEAGLDEPFTIPDGPRQGEQVMMPGIDSHPNCRCGIALKFSKEES